MIKRFIFLFEPRALSSNALSSHTLSSQTLAPIGGFPSFYKTKKGLSAKAGMIAGVMGFVFILMANVVSATAGETTVRATYNITAPIGSGKFRFASSQDGARYKMQGSADFKAFLGFYTWSSAIASNGYINSYKPQPNVYAFNARAAKKSERIRLDFSPSGVKNVRAIPPTKPHPKRIKVTKAHLRNVVDPLSAVMTFTDKAPSLTNGTKACNRSIEIFDGRHRFNVKMSFKRKAYANLSNGKSRTAFVCRAKYRPVSGHKMNKSVSYMSKSNGMEIWLVPLPKVKMYVPYKMVIPIIIGTAYAELASLKCVTQSMASLLWLSLKILFQTKVVFAKGKS